jgi:ribosomal protein S18 acetylase RimI-like enzyme
MVPNFSLRPANEDDINFLWALRQLTMKPYIQESYGWNDDEEYEYATERLMCTRIIHIENFDVGIVKIIEFPDHIHLQQIQVHPEWSNQGIGTQIINDLIRQASKKNKTVRLYVLKNNPAKNLYTRLGFTIQEEFNHQQVMQYISKAEA